MHAPHTPGPRCIDTNKEGIAAAKAAKVAAKTAAKAAAKTAKVAKSATKRAAKVAAKRAAKTAKTAAKTAKTASKTAPKTASKTASKTAAERAARAAKGAAGAAKGAARAAAKAGTDEEHDGAVLVNLLGRRALLGPGVYVHLVGEAGTRGEAGLEVHRVAVGRQLPRQGRSQDNAVLQGPLHDGSDGGLLGHFLGPHGGGGEPGSLAGAAGLGLRGLHFGRGGRNAAAADSAGTRVFFPGESYKQTNATFSSKQRQGRRGNRPEALTREVSKRATPV